MTNEYTTVRFRKNEKVIFRARVEDNETLDGSARLVALYQSARDSFQAAVVLGDKTESIYNGCDNVVFGIGKDREILLAEDLAELSSDFSDALGAFGAGNDEEFGEEFDSSAPDEPGTSYELRSAPFRYLRD